MTETPFFGPWSHWLCPMGSRASQELRRARAFTLCRLENCFGQWLPESLFPKASEKANSRDAIYTRWRTFWCWLWHSFNPEAPGREVVRQLQALVRLEEGESISEEDSAYCRAKLRLSLPEFPKALAATAESAEKLAPWAKLLKKRPLKVMDGSSLTLLADTPENRKAYPPIQCQSHQPSFPMVRFVVFFSLLSGAILAAAQGSLAQSELSLMAQLAGHLFKGDIFVGDRGFGSYPVVAWLQALGVDFIGRTNRGIDGRQRIKTLSRNDWLIQWKRKAAPSPWLSPLQRRKLPPALALRAVKGSFHYDGFRVRQVTVVTTLLDPEEYPAQEILMAYLRRWRLEMCLDDLKSTLRLESLRGRSPAMVHREFYMRLIAHNLIRCAMAEAAREHGAPLERISFKGSLDSLRQFSCAMAQARSNKMREHLWAELLRILAADLVPERPGRREPRAVKRQKRKYPRLKGSRRTFRDPPKRHTRRKISRLRKLGLM